jgi:hypothetical protein
MAVLFMTLFGDFSCPGKIDEECCLPLQCLSLECTMQRMIFTRFQ